MQIRLYLLAAFILVAGLGSAIAIYVNAAEPADSDSNMVYDYQHSKKFRHEMERMGGKLNMVLSETVQEFEELFQGRNLAYTVASSTIVISLGIFYAAGLAGKKIE
ncbi:hypothetical protein [Geobacter sp. OR-1]|uniref:hypothetical protein n=1 Tax=Geobacter sp. OR-1 TaxID=1266765 RepID=UPI001269B2C3|nr:hypothetical protein [Geobacter sp. OR-1]